MVDEGVPKNRVLRGESLRGDSAIELATIGTRAIRPFATPCDAIGVHEFDG
jgi:hypothetical protein